MSAQWQQPLHPSEPTASHSHLTAPFPPFPLPISHLPLPSNSFPLPLSPLHRCPLPPRPRSTHIVEDAARVCSCPCGRSTPCLLGRRTELAPPQHVEGGSSQYCTPNHTPNRNADDGAGARGGGGGAWAGRVQGGLAGVGSVYAGVCRGQGRRWLMVGGLWIGEAGQWPACTGAAV